jgi:hypothetical protein
LVSHLHQLGDRALAGFLDDLSCEVGCAASIERLLAKYRGLDRETLTSLGVDRFALAPLRAVGR